MPPIKKLLLAAAAISIAFAGEALAHAHLKSAVPAVDGAVKTGEGMLMNDGTTLMVPVTDKLAPGKYTVEWHALSTDGHKTNGTYGFTIAP